MKKRDGMGLIITLFYEKSTLSEKAPEAIQSAQEF